MKHFARVIAFGCVLAVIAAVCTPSEVNAQKKKDKKVDNGYAALPEDYKAIQNKKELTGEIVAVSGAVVTLRVDNPKVEPNPKYKPPTTGPGVNSAENRLYQDGLRLQRDYTNAMNNKNLAQRQQALLRYQQDMIRYQNDMARLNSQLLTNANKNVGKKDKNGNNISDPFIVVHNYKEYDLETQDKVVVRKMFLPQEFDDMGNVKKWTEKEKADLRVDDKKPPVYVAKLEEAAPGMEARLHLTAPPKKKKDKETKSDDEPGAGEVERPTINMIVLLKDNPSSSNIPSASDPKKKKNQ